MTWARILWSALIVVMARRPSANSHGGRNRMLERNACVCSRDGQQRLNSLRRGLELISHGSLALFGCLRHRIFVGQEQDCVRVVGRRPRAS